MDRGTQEVYDRAVALVRELLRTDPTVRVPILRQIAELLVDVREHFLRPDGTPDWRGRSWAYREFARKVYSDAGVPSDELATLQAAVRYHAGSVLRHRLDAETLDAYGLQQETPRERVADRNAHRSAVYQALATREFAGGALLALSTAHTVLGSLDPTELADLPDREAGIAGEVLGDIEATVRRLRRKVRRAAAPE